MYCSSLRRLWPKRESLFSWQLAVGCWLLTVDSWRLTVDSWRLAVVAIAPKGPVLWHPGIYCTKNCVVWPLLRAARRAIASYNHWYRSLKSRKIVATVKIMKPYCYSVTIKLSPFRAQTISDPCDFSHPVLSWLNTSSAYFVIWLGLSREISITKQRKNLTRLVECVVSPNGVAV